MIRNLRDVGKTMNNISGNDLMKSGVLFRSGSLNGLDNTDRLPPVSMIVNLRRQTDPDFPGINNIQIAPVGEMNNYMVQTSTFQDWIKGVLDCMSESKIYPVLLHCTAGKDRTGIAVAVILSIIGFSKEQVVKEYMLSEGVRGDEYIKRALNILAASNWFLENADIKGKLCRNLLRRLKSFIG